MNSETFEQSIWIDAPVETVDRTITDRDTMHEWLNPMLSCEPVQEWSTDIGAESLFRIKLPLVQPTLRSVVRDRQPGLVVWGFEGYFTGSDRWECTPERSGTRLTNRFTFTISNPLIAFGFRVFAATLTKRDMEQQLKRLKAVAERLTQTSDSSPIA